MVGMLGACAAKERAPVASAPKAVEVPPPPQPMTPMVVMSRAQEEQQALSSVSYEPAPPAESVEQETAAPSQPAPLFVSKCKDVTLTIKAKAITASGMELDVELANAGRRPVTLMRTNDGSDANMRNPSVSFDLTPRKIAPQGRCGLINAFDDHDIVTLAPGARIKLEWLYPPHPSAPGRYTLRATYRNDPAADPMRGKAPAPSAAQLARVDATTACEVTSNGLSFDWPAKTPNP